MNLNELFQIQAKLDNRIVEEHNLHGVDLLDKKILALQVELGELANEWRGFKFWSTDQEPRTEIFTTSPLPDEPFVVKKNPLLEEYVDCLHFILSIGLEIKIETDELVIDSDYREETTTETFNELFLWIADLRTEFNEGNSYDLEEKYELTFNLFVGLGEMDLGFTWEQIEQAYLDKNKINHERQENGY